MKIERKGFIMKKIAVLAFVMFAFPIFSLDKSEVLEAVEAQEKIVSPLLDEVKNLSPDVAVENLSEIMERYRNALQLTETMIDKTNGMTYQEASVGSDEMSMDECDEIEMLYCSTVNNLRKMTELIEHLQQHAGSELKSKLEQELGKLRSSLK